MDTFSLIKGNSIIIYSKWIFSFTGLKLVNDIYYIIYKIDEYVNKITHERSTIELLFKKNSGNDIKDLSPLPFMIYITDVYINKNLDHVSTFKVQYNKNSNYSLSIDARLKRQREFLKEKKRKKPKFNEKQIIDILLIGTNHQNEEAMLKSHFPQFNDFFLLPFLNDKIITEDGIGERNRNPYLFFWEHRPNDDDNGTKINRYDGKNSSSFNIPIEYDLLSGMTNLKSSFTCFNYPLKIDKSNNIITHDSNYRQAILAVNKGICDSHGMSLNDIGEDKNLYGTKNQVAMLLGWLFIGELWDSYIAGGNVFIGFKIFFNDDNQIEYILELLKDVTDKILKSNQGLVQKLINKIALEYKEKYSYQYFDEEYIQFLNDLNLPLNKPERVVFTNRYHLMLLRYRMQFKLYDNEEHIKTFIYNLYSLIFMNSNSKFIDLKEIRDIELKYINKDNMMVIDNDDKEISPEYFKVLMDKIKEDLVVDIPTLYVNYFFYFLRTNGIFVPNSEWFFQGRLIVDLRNILSFYSVINICKENNIKRSIVAYGGGHILHFDRLVKSYTDPGLRLNSTMFMINHQKIKVAPEKILKKIKSTDILNKLDAFQNDLTLYFNIESIDNWLYNTEYNNYKISSSEQKPSEETETRKLQFIINLTDIFKNEYEPLLSNEEVEKIIRYMGIYLGLLYYSNPPVINSKINNNKKEYFHNHYIKNEESIKYILPFIKLENIKDAGLRIQGPFKRYGYGNPNLLTVVNFDNDYSIYTFVSKLYQDIKTHGTIFI
jgi:hypothetical protein